MPSAPAPTVSTMFVRDLTEDQDLDQILLVRAAELRYRRDGSAVLRLTLGDRSGQVAAIAREDVEVLRELCVPGRPVRVAGRFEVHPRWGPQIVVAALTEPLPGSFDLADLVDGPPRSAQQMEADLRALVATIQDPHLRALLDRILGEHTESWRRLPQRAGRQALPPGLRPRPARALALGRPGRARDRGALPRHRPRRRRHRRAAARHRQARGLHGRLRGASTSPTPAASRARSRSATTAIRREIEDIPGFPADTAQAVLHIILSHHGSLAHGSPVVPCTREATLVHQIDNLGGRLGSFDRLEKELSPGRAGRRSTARIGSSAYFGPAVADERRAA